MNQTFENLKSISTSERKRIESLSLVEKEYFNLKITYEDFKKKYMQPEKLVKSISGDQPQNLYEKTF